MLEWIDDQALEETIDAAFEDTSTFQGLWHHSVEIDDHMPDDIQNRFNNKFEAISFGVTLPRDIISFDPLLDLVKSAKNIVCNHIHTVLGIKPDYVEDIIYSQDGSFSLVLIPWYDGERYWIKDENHAVFSLVLETKLLYFSLGKNPLVRYIIDVLLGRTTSIFVKLLPTDVDYRLENGEILIRSRRLYDDINDELKALKQQHIFAVSYYSENEIYSMLEVAQMFKYSILNNCELFKTDFKTLPYLLLQQNVAEFDQFFFDRACKEIMYQLPRVVFGASFDSKYEQSIERHFIASLAFKAIATFNPILQNYTDNVTVEGPFVGCNLANAMEMEIIRELIEQFKGVVRFKVVRNQDEALFYQYYLATQDIISIILKYDRPVIAYSLPAYIEDRRDIELPLITLPPPPGKILQYRVTPSPEYSRWLELNKPIFDWQQTVFQPIVPAFDMTAAKIDGKINVWLTYTTHTLCPKYDTDTGQNKTIMLTSLTSEKDIEVMITQWIKGDIISDWCKVYLFYTGFSSFIVLK